jgi:hypothetical protein
MKIKKRKKKPKRLSYYEQSTRRLKKKLKQARKKAVPDDLTTALTLESDLEKQDEIEKEIDQRILAAQSKIVKKAVADANKFISYIRVEHKRELEYSGQRYPRKWMLKDPKIKAVIENRRVILDFANYLFDYTRHVKWEWVHQMTELVHGQMYEDKHSFALFKADSDFYHKVAKELNCAPITLQKLLKQFCEAEIVRKIGSVATYKRGGQPGLYSDGYYIDWDGKPIKHPFLTQKNKAALLTLSKKI